MTEEDCGRLISVVFTIIQMGDEEGLVKVVAIEKRGSIFMFLNHKVL